MAEKRFISAQELLEDSFCLGRRVLESGFRPDFIVGVWRGGTPVGIAVQELLEHNGVPSDHIAIRTSSYEGIERRGRQIRIHGLGYIVDNAGAEQRLLIVDDVYDTGLSIQAIIASLHERSRRNTPHDIRVATVFYKPGTNCTGRTPDFYVHATDKWLVFPHELIGLEPGEIARHKPEVGLSLEKEK